MAATILAAEFTNGSKTRPALLTVTQIDPRSGQRVELWSRPVSDKREARAIATAHAAKPWNF